MLQALFQARIESQYQSITENTVGIVFLGTPHRGSDKADYGKILANVATSVMNKPKPRLISALQSNSDSLMRLTSDFRHQLPNYKVVSFYETKPITMFSTLVSRGFRYLILAKLILVITRLLRSILRYWKFKEKIRSRLTRTTGTCANSRHATTQYMRSSSTESAEC